MTGTLLVVDDYLENPSNRRRSPPPFGARKREPNSPLRRYLALATRLDIVETVVDTGPLSDSETYRHAVSALETEMEALGWVTS